MTEYCSLTKSFRDAKLGSLMESPTTSREEVNATRRRLLLLQPHPRRPRCLGPSHGFGGHRNLVGRNTCSCIVAVGHGQRCASPKLLRQDVHIERCPSNTMPEIPNSGSPGVAWLNCKNLRLSTVPPSHRHPSCFSMHRRLFYLRVFCIKGCLNEQSVSNLPVDGVICSLKQDEG